MKFGLVVLGAHIGIHIKDEISKIKDSSILLVEPVPHNISAIKENLKEFKNCLLYTSPSPRDLDLSRMPSSA